MGQAKKRKQRFLTDHTRCCYCGLPATTIDHFPPRNFFKGRNWPVGYEFPACHTCNHDKSRDEQSLGFLVRLIRFDNDTDTTEFQDALIAVRNNNPILIRELVPKSAVASKLYLRGRFGSAENVGEMGLTGWRGLSIGPEANRLTDNMCVWFAQTAWYLHCHSIFEGRIIWSRIETEFLGHEAAQKIVSNLVGKPEMLRNGKNVSSDFFYRYFASDDIFVGIFQFGRRPQMVFVVCATRKGAIDTDLELEKYWGQRSIDLPQEA